MPFKILKGDITKYEVELIVNFGVCGGLVPEMALNSTVVVDRVVHYDIDTSTVDEGIVPGQYLGNPDIYIRVDEKILEIAKEAVNDGSKIKVAIATKGYRYKLHL